MDSDTKQYKQYKIGAKYKKTSYKEQHWTHRLSNGKQVKLLITKYYRWGIFNISLTDKQKEDILKKKRVILNPYGVSFDELCDMSDQYEDIENRDKYTREELDEINMLIYNTTDENIECKFNERILKENNWYFIDTIYGLASECELIEN